MEAGFTTETTEKGTEIVIETDSDKVAVIIREKEEERIYLPYEIQESSQSYYNESQSSVEELNNGYKVLHRGSIDEIEIIT